MHFKFLIKQILFDFLHRAGHCPNLQTEQPLWKFKAPTSPVALATLRVGHDPGGRKNGNTKITVVGRVSSNNLQESFGIIWLGIYHIDIQKLNYTNICRMSVFTEIHVGFLRQMLLQSSCSTMNLTINCCKDRNGANEVGHCDPL